MGWIRWACPPTRGTATRHNQLASRQGMACEAISARLFRRVRETWASPKIELLPVTFLFYLC